MYAYLFIFAWCSIWLETSVSGYLDPLGMVGADGTAGGLITTPNKVLYSYK